jgi:hypothetical protein
MFLSKISHQSLVCKMDKSCVSKISSISSLLNSEVAVIEVTFRGLIYVNGIVTLFLPPRAEQNSQL